MLLGKMLNCRVFKIQRSCHTRMHSSPLSQQSSWLAVPAVIHQKTSFQESAASFPAPAFLLSLSGISSHQIFLAVYKTLTVHLFWVLKCAKEVFCFPSLVFCWASFNPQRKAWGAAWRIFCFCSPFLRVKQKHKVKEEKKFVSLTAGVCRISLT